MTRTATATDADNGGLMHRSIARRMGIAIIDGEWAEGDSRTLDDIQRHFSISRTVAREAGRQLEALGMVTARRRVGLIVLPAEQWHTLEAELIDWRLHSSQRLQQLYSLTQLRAAVEPSAAESAARLASDEVKERLVAQAAELRRLGEAGQGQSEEFMTLDTEFHSSILRNSGNELYARMADHVAVVLRGRTELGFMPSNPKPEALAAHDGVARAIAEGNPEMARMTDQAIIDEVRVALSAIPRPGLVPTGGPAPDEPTA